MVGWHHRLNGHEFEQTPGDSEGQGNLACCSLWGRKELDMTGQQQQTQTLAKLSCRSPLIASQPGRWVPLGNNNC